MTELEQGGRVARAAAGRRPRRRQGLRQDRGHRPLPRGRRPDPDRRRDVLQLLPRAGDRAPATRWSRRRSSWPARRWSGPKQSDCELVLPVDLVLGREFSTPTTERTRERRGGGARRLDGPRHRTPQRRGSTPRPSPEAGTVLWNGPMGAFEMEPFAGRHPRRRRGGRRGAGDDRGRRRRLGRGAEPVRPRRTRSTGSRPAAAPRWSCWRERSCRASRPCSTPDEETPSA